MPSIETLMRGDIARGVALLNEKEPGWYNHIDVDRLDMAQGLFLRDIDPSEPSGCGCVLAQFDARGRDRGRYSTAFYRLHIEDRSAELGFCLPARLYMGSDDGPRTEEELTDDLQTSMYKDLTVLWKTVILNLRRSAILR